MFRLLISAVLAAILALPLVACDQSKIAKAVGCALDSSLAYQGANFDGVLDDNEASLFKRALTSCGVKDTPKLDSVIRCVAAGSTLQGINLDGTLSGDEVRLITGAVEKCGGETLEIKPDEQVDQPVPSPSPSAIPE